MRRTWKTHDLLDLFRSTQRGNLSLNCITNHNIEDWTDFYSIPLDNTWPDSIQETHSSYMEFKIETDIPIPCAQGANDGTAQAMVTAMKQLQVGQSFFVPLRNEKDMARNLQTLFGQNKKLAPGAVFISRKVTGDDKKETGIRIWRLE